MTKTKPVAKFSSEVFEVFMMAINNKNETNQLTQGPWFASVTSYGPDIYDKIHLLYKLHTSLSFLNSLSDVEFLLFRLTEFLVTGLRRYDRKRNVAQSLW